jgi:hypothetical protein
MSVVWHLQLQYLLLRLGYVIFATDMWSPKMKSTGVYKIIPIHIFHTSMTINQWNIFGGGRGETSTAHCFFCTDIAFLTLCYFHGCNSDTETMNLTRKFGKA